MKKNLRHIVGAALIGALMFGLGGCSIFSKFQGQSAEQATEQLRSVEGLDGEIKVDGSYSGFTKNTGSVLNVTISSDYEISNKELFSEWLINILWSVNDEKPNISLALNVSFAGEAANYDWGGQQTLQNLGFSTANTYSSNIAISVTVSASEVENKLGSWPGKVPEVPEGMLTRVSE